ncbi:MAG: HAMP domain-containing histidine kinase [Chthoniobacterales bacterium]|nr:HAMP domain-containing histidine kinase [Chthoniobacterales bacterium]
MSAPAEPRPTSFRLFRIKLLIAMMLVVSVLTSLGIYFAQRRAAQDAQDDLQRDFQLELASLHRLQDLRNAAVLDRTTALARNPRIHAALEDNALDLLYPSAREEMRDLMQSTPRSDALQARFYRFLDGNGTVIVPPANDAGALLPNEEKSLAQKSVPQTMQVGYFVRRDGNGATTVDEMIAVPIRSTETNSVIAALVLGFKPVAALVRGNATGMNSGILVNGKLELPTFDPTAEDRVIGEIENESRRGPGEERSLRVLIAGVPHLLFFKQLNPKSNYPPAYEVCVYPLTQLLARQQHLRAQILTGGVALLLGGFVICQFLARRLSRPVEKLAVVSEENFAQRRQAEAKLQTTTEELQRSARFSADASHQLKSPITVLRAGLDSLLSRDGFPQEIYEEISLLIHQTYRLTGVVEDLLLLSRMDAGRLRLTMSVVDLAQLVEEWADDLHALPEAADLSVQIDLPPKLKVAGEKKYTDLIVQNLLDNARKYNRPHGLIRVSARAEKNQVELRVANTGRGIPAEAQPDIFERFHRAGAGDDVPGHGLGLNLARELARLHGGDLRLVRSDAEYTEFSALFIAG